MTHFWRRMQVALKFWISMTTPNTSLSCRGRDSFLARQRRRIRASGYRKRSNAKKGRRPCRTAATIVAKVIISLAFAETLQRFSVEVVASPLRLGPRVRTIRRSPPRIVQIVDARVSPRRRVTIARETPFRVNEPTPERPHHRILFPSSIKSGAPKR